MAVPVPDGPQLEALARHFHLGLSSAEVAEFAPAVAGTFASSDAVEALYRRSAPTAPAREWAPGEHPLGAWYVTTELSDPAGAGGPLAGRTVAIKDNVAVAGVPMMNGSASVEGFVPTRDATTVTRLLAAGATITGKSVCEDLCFSGASFTSKPAPVRNPWDPTRNAGGSSSGSAVLVATGEVDLALGGDQGGSVRIPSSFSGTVGHKPTFGLVPYTGAFPIEQTIDHLGPITRSVADAALMLGVLAGPDGHDPRQPTRIDPVDYVASLAEPAAGLRVGVLTEGFGLPNSDPGVDAAVRAAVDVLRAAGLDVDEVSIPWHLDAMHVWNVIATEGAAYQMIEGNAYGMNWSGLYDPELIAHYHRNRMERGAELSKTVKLVAMSGWHTFQVGGGSYYAMAQNLVPEVRGAYDAVLSDHDVLVMPTLPYTARTIPAPDATLMEYLDVALSMIGNTAPFDISGHPACSVPTELVGGLPAGMMIVGRRFDDATVLRVAHTYEQAVGGFPAAPALTTMGTSS
jgi:amidase